jgi:glycine/D-amino acid oxidase-like deaminating enzyme
VATGGARKGILYGPAMGQAIADLVLGRKTRVALDAFAPAGSPRFVKQGDCDG